jgi:hypothetical protein
MPALIAYIKNYPKVFLGIVVPYIGPRLPLVFTMQNVKRPMTVGVTIIVLAQKNLFNWYGLREHMAK